MSEKLIQIIETINNLIKIFEDNSIDSNNLKNTISILEKNKNNPLVLENLLKETSITIKQVRKKLNETNSNIKRKKIKLNENIDIHTEKKESEQLINNLYL
ncbi:MAG: hypothetical protein PHH06_00290 [Candidatus Gracilibacteria bacterium]|nr:hypothetical protein [Candidatus Gracilibacteria bacterium]